MIMTVDPARGSLSQALRNRGLELFLPAPEVHASGHQLSALQLLSQVCARAAEHGTCMHTTHVCLGDVGQPILHSVLLWRLPTLMSA